MIIDSFDAIFYTAIFILPGFIVNSVIDTANPPQKQNEGIYLLKCIFFSLISCAIYSWLYKIVIDCEKISTSLHWILLIVISIAGSFFLGIAIAIIKQHQWLAWMLSKLKINTIHTTPTAWDYYFSKQKSSFVIITLLDDTKLYGWYSNNSFTSSDYEERDIFVEKGYIFENGNWEEDSESEGFYVAKDQIKLIEFKKGE